MSDLLIITPYHVDGRDIDAVTDFVMDAHHAGALPPLATTQHARGVAQALEAMRLHEFRAIIVGDYLKIQRGLGGGVTEIWDAVERQRLFFGARITFTDMVHGGDPR